MRPLPLLGALLLLACDGGVPSGTDPAQTDTDPPTPVATERCPGGFVEAVRTTFDPSDLTTPLLEDTSWYGPDGSTLHASDHVGADGTLSSSLRTRFDGDRQTERLQGSPSYVDTTTYTWTADGSQMVQEDDALSDGTIEARETNTYDSEGRRLTWTVDSDGDGTPESHHAWTWQDDQPLTYDVDLGADGVFEHHTAYTLDDRSRPLRAEKSVLDREPDPNEIEIWTYDGVCTTSYRRESYFFANPDIDTWTYACDAQGLRTDLALDTDDDGVPEQWVEYDRDDAGQITEERHYQAGSTEPVRILQRSWDDTGWQIAEERDEDGDGTPDQRWTETWTCVGSIPPTPLIPSWTP